MVGNRYEKSDEYLRAIRNAQRNRDRAVEELAARRNRLREIDAEYPDFHAAPIHIKGEIRSLENRALHLDTFEVPKAQRELNRVRAEYLGFLACDGIIGNFILTDTPENIVAIFREAAAIHGGGV